MERKVRKVVKCLLIFLFTVIIQKILAQNQVTGTRELPDSYTPGSEIDVVLNIDVDESNAPNGIIVVETPPSGWTITSSNPPFESFDGTTYKWVFTGAQVKDMEITYTVSIPSDASGSVTFSGQIKYNDPSGDEQIENIGGDTTISTLSPAELSFNPDTLIFAPDTDTLNITITNTGGSDLIWNASYNVSWVSMSETSGTLSAGESEEIAVNVNRTGLSSGTHSATINFTSNDGTATVNVILIVESPSPPGSFNAYGAPGGIFLIWENPSEYIGVIIFKKEGSAISSNPVDGVNYDLPGNPYGYSGYLSDGSECILKDNTGLTTFFDDITSSIGTFYNIYSYADTNYSVPLSTHAQSQSLLGNPSVFNFGTDFTYFINGTGTSMDGFRIEIPSGSLSGSPPANFYFGPIDTENAPDHLGLLGFVNIYGVLTSNVNLISPVYIKIPVYQQDINSAGINKIEDLKVYQWNSNKGQWEELNIVGVEETGNPSPVGYITVEVEDLGEMNYFSCGYPFIPSGGGGGCFIATAAYGTTMAKEVIVLKKFRDKYLLTNKPGRAFVRWYYKHSPEYAKIIRKRPVLKAIVRVALKPLIFFINLLPGI